MLKVFLVEDEFVVREGIRNIDWMSEGFKFCGEASDGELAFPLIRNETPDIMITDIKMPFLDGLDLSRLVKKELPQTKIIILSGHEEFVYAQEALKIGVTEYLLKPITSAELIEAVKRIGKQIDIEREEKKNLERYKHEMEENEIDSKRKLFIDMVSGANSIARILDKGKKLSLDLSALSYQIILFKYSVPGDGENYSSELLALSRELGGIGLHTGSVIVFDRAVEGTALLIKGESPEEIDRIREDYLSEIKSILEKYPTVHYFGGIGKQVGRLTHLAESFETASHAFSLRFIVDKNAFISTREIAARQHIQENALGLDVSEMTGADRKKVDAFLKNGEEEEISFFVEEFLKSIGSASEKSFLFRQYILLDVFFSAQIFLKEIGETDGLPDGLFPLPDRMNEALNDTERGREYIERVFAAAIRRRDELRKKRNHRLIEQVKEYLGAHYSDENMSLNSAAAYFNISPSYFSAVFSRETGQSLIKYLTDLRMNKAKELLKCSDMHCSEISAAVGYRDPHYFSFLFKKTQNCSPIQYRMSKN